MAVLITEIIPQQGFETVLNRIGAILLEEVSNQITLQSIENTLGVYIERMTEYDTSDDVMINVSCNNISYAGQNQSGSQGEVTYYVDLYCSGYQTDLKSGSTVSLDVQNKFLGIVRYILSSTKYKTLGFQHPLIGGVNVQSIQKDDTYKNEDARFIRFSRLTMTVRVNEIQDMWTPSEFTGNDTIIKVNDTEKGYKLILNNQ